MNRNSKQASFRWHGLRSLLAAAAILGAAWAHAFDHTHAQWTNLLAAHVQVSADGTGSRVDYAGFAQDRPALRTYLTSLSAVSTQTYDTWSKAQRFAFLANAYNAFTIEKILTRYPHLASIRDFGLIFGNPWKDRFFTLLGRRRHLDELEHRLLRAPGVFDEPRVHVAVNCAAIGCPMLANEAFVADRLNEQLETRMRAFLSDRSRNRYNRKTQTLELSAIFDWYHEDFKGGGHSFLGWPRLASLQALGARYAQVLADHPEDREALRQGQSTITFVKYDWSLNAITSP
ncbi:MAG TPA: DUF547 domain-containing protein [Burkholderiaceae bacterium]|nr:DUF547 domain-containing protein [Burkholderiaceae bacterium]